MSLTLAAARPDLTRLFDWLERIAVAIMSGCLIWSLSKALTDPINILLLVSEGMMVAFILTRRFSREASARPADWLAAAVGALAPLAVAPGGHEIAPSALSYGLMIGGALTQIFAKLTLFRSFGIVAANRGIKPGGPYQAVRHPMYLGYMLVWAGYWLHSPTLRNSAAYLLASVLIVVRILAEERVLSLDPAYQALKENTRFRLLPGLW